MPKKIQEPEKKKPAKKSKKLPEPVVEPEPEQIPVIEEPEPEAVVVEAAEPEESPAPVEENPELGEFPSGLAIVDHANGGIVRRPTPEELLAIGKAMVEGLFGSPEVQAALQQRPGAGPAPKLTTPHCRTCKFFSPNDSRGALWATGGHCLALQHVQPEVESPEYYCNRFIFNEGLRDNN